MHERCGWPRGRERMLEATDIRLRSEPDKDPDPAPLPVGAKTLSCGLRLASFSLKGDTGVEVKGPKHTR